MCELEDNFVRAEDTSVAQIASAIIHEAIHARLMRLGFGYEEPKRLRIEQICFGAQQAFAEKLGLTYPLLSDFSRDTVKKYGVMYDDPNEARFRMAKRAYFVIDKQGIIRYAHVMEEARHLLDPEEIFNTVKTIVTAAQ